MPVIHTKCFAVLSPIETEARGIKKNCLFSDFFGRIHTIPSVPIVDCFQKIKQQVKCYLQMAGGMGKQELQEVCSYSCYWTRGKMLVNLPTVSYLAMAVWKSYMSSRSEMKRWMILAVISLILRRSKVARTHSLLTQSDVLFLRACSWRHLARKDSRSFLSSRRALRLSNPRI